MIYRYAIQDDIDDVVLPPDVVDDVVLSLSRMMLLKNTLPVKGECWNNVTTKSILIIIDILFIESIPIVDWSCRIL